VNKAELKERLAERIEEALEDCLDGGSTTEVAQRVTDEILDIITEDEDVLDDLDLLNHAGGIATDSEDL
jgi:hypothetical protein